MPTVSPVADPNSPAASIAAAAADPAVGEAGFGFYVHVPFCVSRCGYCDFNTYTAAELGAGVSRDTYASIVRAEIRDAAVRFGERSGANDGHSVKRPKVDTVFFGGGTPTLLSAADLASILAEIDDAFGLAPGYEATTEANPESVDADYLAELHDGGFTRLSVGMQSTASHVLKILDREHSPQKALNAVEYAHKAGFEHVSLDLIYGTPGETAADFAASLHAAVDAGVDHVSAYALIVEDGTALARRIRSGQVPQPSDDVAADRYLAAEAVLSEAGFHWYEVSNWARTEAAQCRHNLLYWEGGHWWGAGPGAHSHLPGVRWWNHKHPSTYGAALAQGLPAAGHELLTEDDRYLEQILLRTRLASGLPLALLRPAGRAAADRAVGDGLVVIAGDRLELTLRGRLLADAVVRDLTS
ncbi:radical SAM family heme chaperone HemW [Glycomyces algeriensis]|uniref:radical SAM family heme chaperone HemW n=1 Tax=Glycomyces algeriensis TaxID=256037 RepID=UPI0022DBC1A9|nr:radical SAM family heme chaperone HemW [Glycomyces algeriensis]MDA1369054.1 radical SAM family heme chaperone HemW [Glycomyces algeriensis]MDR7352450.1 oxygen-independent coproporphyrinogen-3 oxidase [Glycomyces algeriensis]